jgi:peptidoglycan/LPS O-acetylase OafA/YrhL
MTVTINSTTINSTTIPNTASRPASSLWRPGLKAGVAAAVATTAVASIASALGVAFESAPGDAIPLAGFAQLTLVFTIVGVLIARAIRNRGAHPRSTFTKTAVVLLALSVVPDLTMSFDLASKLTLMLTHVVAAAIVIPALASRLPEHS